MKRIFSFFAAILFAASMMAGVGNEYYNVTFLKSSGPSGYDKTGDYAYGGITWTIPGNITNGDYIRVGGKGIDHQERYIFSQAPLNDAIAKIVIAHNGKSRANVTLHTVTVVVASDADFTEDVVTTEYEVGEDEIQKNTEGEIVIVPAPTIVSWATGSYYKFIFKVSNPDTSNGGIDVMSITFFSYQDDDAAAINASNIDLGLISTTELPFSVEKELVVTGANLSSPISYETDGEHLSLSGTLTAEGGSLIVTITAAEEGEIDEIITLTSDDVETIVSVKANIIKTDGDGSQDNPFSASDVVKLNNNYGNEKAWVMGYIVGCAASGGQIATSATNSNIAIGDATDQTENVVPVQLPNNDIRAALNIVDNPSNVGRQVKVFGQLIAYFSFTGVQNVSDYEFVGDAPITVAKPVITPEEATFTEPITVSITCETEGATIRYTLDGTDPTANSLEYSEPFEISETTTVKAIAFLEDAQSAIATMTYTLVDPSALISCAEVYGLDDNTDAKLNEVTVTYVSGKNVWVKDASGAVFLFMKSSASFAAGAKLQGVVGTKKLYSGLVEIELNADQQAAIEATAGEAPAPEELTAAIDEAKDMSKYVLLKDVTVAEGSFTTSSSTSLNMTFAGIQVALYNKFKLAATFAASKTYNVIGLVSKHNSDLQVNFISAEEAGVAPVTVAKPTFEPTGTTFTESITVSITCETEGATIRYTLDGTDPTANSLEYSEPFEISETTTVKAIAFLEDAQSDIASITYTKKADPVIPTGGFVKVTEAPSSWEGDYLIVYEPESVAFNGGLETLDAAKNNIAVTITDGVIEATDENMAAIFSIEALEEGGYAVKAANGQYIGVSTYGNGLKQSDNPFEHNTPSLDEDGNAILSISGEEWAGDMILNFNSNANDKRFRYYKNGSQKKIALYKLTEESGEPSISASDIALGEIETESDVYETELTLTVKGKNLDSPISFESSNSEIVAVSGQLDETGGTLTVNIAVPASEEGTALNETITLTSDNVVKVVAVTAIVKKVVPVPPTGKKYILADIENIAPDQSVIIAMETNYGAKAAVNVFAMSIPENASTAPAAVSVTAEDGAIITDATDIFWNIVKDEDGNYLIYPDGTTDKGLHCINQNNGVRVGTGEANTFEILQAEEAQGGGMYLHNIGNNRYLGIYNSTDWRCYGSVNNNIKNQNLRLYVYSGTTAIDNTKVMEKATKFIQNGHLFIIKGDRIYNVMGQIIR